MQRANPLSKMIRPGANFEQICCNTALLYLEVSVDTSVLPIREKASTLLLSDITDRVRQTDDRTDTWID